MLITYRMSFSVTHREHEIMWPRPNTCSEPTEHRTVSLLLTVELHLLSLQMDDEPFNPDYVEVDRVLDVSESTDENGEVL